MSFTGHSGAGKTTTMWRVGGGLHFKRWGRDLTCLPGLSSPALFHLRRARPPPSTGMTSAQRWAEIRRTWACVPSTMCSSSRWRSTSGSRKAWPRGDPQEWTSGWGLRRDQRLQAAAPPPQRLTSHLPSVGDLEALKQKRHSLNLQAHPGGMSASSRWPSPSWALPGHHSR